MRLLTGAGCTRPKASSTTISHDSAIDLSEGSYVPAIEAIAYTNTVKLTCLYMGTEIDRFFWRIGEGHVIDPNECLKFEAYKEAFDGRPVEDITKMCKIVSVSNISSAGVFNRYEVVLQMVQEV